jgi:plastocyanin domain-containing protein
VKNIEMKVTDNGFEPSELRVRAGEEVRLSIKRTYARTCATSIQSAGGIAKTTLPLGQTVEVAFTPDKAGTFRFGCAMGMHIGGELIVEA